jgi:hypothetical protein
MGEDQALASLHQILARPEYQVHASVPWWQQLLSPVLERAWTLISQAFATLSEITSGQQGAYGWSVVGVCLVLLVAVIVYLVRSVRLTMLRESSLASESLAQRRERSDQLWREAQALAMAGRHAEAVPLAYLSALYALDERALLHVERSLTNREHARALAQLHPTIGMSFSRVVDDYDRFRYGHAPIGAESFNDFSTGVAHVRDAVFAA